MLCELGYTNKPAKNFYPPVWWCATRILSFLPIHSAGYHREHRTVMDRVISSYTSTIRALEHSRESIRNPRISRVLIAAMPTTPKLPRLPLAKDEVYKVRQVVRKQPGFITDPVIIRPSKKELLDSLSGKNIVHLVCHADAVEDDPSSSCLYLKDGSITVAQISDLKPLGGALAYLSAPSTAMNRANKLEDEVLTLTSAFQVAGFTRVVGKLWNAEDYDA